MRLAAAIDHDAVVAAGNSGIIVAGAAVVDGEIPHVARAVHDGVCFNPLLSHRGRESHTACNLILSRAKGQG